MATEISMNRAMAAGRVSRPRMTIAPQTVSTVATNGPKKSGYGMPIFANRPAACAAGYRNLRMPSFRNTPPTTRRIRILALAPEGSQSFFPRLMIFLLSSFRSRFGGFFRSPGPVKSKIPEQMTVAGHTVPGAEQQAEMFGEIIVPAEIECGITVVGVRVPVLRPELAAQRQMRSKIALHQPAGEGVIALAGSGIQYFAATTVGRPGSPALLQPQRQAKPRPSIAQAPAGLTRRQFGHGKNPDLRPAVGLMDKPVFHAQFHVAQADLGGRTVNAHGGHWQHQMQLGVGQHAVVQFNRRATDAVIIDAGMIADAKQVKFPMLIIHRLRVVRQKRRTGEGGYGKHQNHPQGE